MRRSRASLRMKWSLTPKYVAATSTVSSGPRVGAIGASGDVFIVGYTPDAQAWKGSASPMAAPCQIRATKGATHWLVRYLRALFAPRISGNERHLASGTRVLQQIPKLIARVRFPSSAPYIVRHKCRFSQYPGLVSPKVRLLGA
jgi:hypothetical protein